MAHLDEITVGCQLNGIAARETVTVIAVQWYGNAALEVTFKNSRGQLGSQILYRGDEATVDVLGEFYCRCGPDAPCFGSISYSSGAPV